MKVLTNWALSATAFLFLSLLGYHSAYFPLYPPFCVIFFDSPIEQKWKNPTRMNPHKDGTVYILYLRFVNVIYRVFKHTFK